MDKRPDRAPGRRDGFQKKWKTKSFGTPGGAEEQARRHKGLLSVDVSCHVLTSRAAFASCADKVAPNIIAKLEHPVLS